ncbi:D-alanine--poly(phosphoribitol) ligase subunit DltA [Nocardiopsis alba]|uniref:D-alanine--poly(phosphoribitol) ligase subunit DltA n=1 Tax=Nocardiopsis alba TaxID=53437 RepID=UPI0033E4BF0C
MPEIQNNVPGHDVSAFVREVRDRGLHFFLEDGRLKSAGSGYELSSEERGYVRRHKAEIIAHLLPGSQTISGTDTSEPAPLSYQQERLWLLHEIAERSEEYNSVTVLAVHGAFDPQRFGTALRRVVEENPALRTVFRETGETVRQVVLDEGPLIDLVTVDSPELALETARALERDEAGHQFDLRGEVPVRCRLVSAPGNVHHIVLNIHHIACDGWSIALVMERLSAYYGDMDAVPAADTRTYGDYALWQRRTLTGDVLDSLVDRWQERFEDAPLTHNLPRDLEPGAAERNNGHVVRHRIGQDRYEAFRRLCVDNGTNEFTGLHAVLAVLLAGVSGQPETVVGSPIANREQQGIHETVGFFVNMICVRGEVDEESTFRDVLSDRKAEVDFGLTFQQAPFEKLVERLSDHRGAGTTPVFQVVLALQNNRVVQPRFGEAVARTLPETHHRNRFDLEVFVHDEGAGGREVEWVYNSELFEAATVERWADWFARLLEEVTERPDTPVSRLSALTCGAAGPQGLQAPPDLAPRDEDPRDRATVDVLRRIREVALREPDRIAVSDGARTETYAQLLARGTEIGAALSERHGPDAVYAFSMDRSIDLVRALVGVMSIGATYVALDSADPPGRRAAVIEASGASCLLIADDDPPNDLVDLERIDVRALGRRGAAPGRSATKATGGEPGAVRGNRDLYYVFTSGSTGRPKGVRVTYANLATYLGGVLPRLRLPDGAGYCWHSSVATDFGNTVLFGALSTGGRLEIATRDDILDGAAMQAFIDDRGIDVLKITPSHLEALIEAHPVAGVMPRAILVLGGEAVSRAVVRALAEAEPDISVFNHYGPSEATVGVFVAELDDLTDPRVLPIGRPLPGIDFRVEADNGEEAPFGVAGELVLKGPQVARGYLEQPPGVPSAFTGVENASPAERVYRTGDRVRRRNDGQLVFLGRRDGQVKIRGHRVELGEIKAGIEAVAGVTRGEVVVVPGTEGPPELVAFVQRDEEAPPTPEAPPTDSMTTVAQWREFYDYAYSDRVSGDIEFNTSGWISSYTGRRIPDEEMRDWLDSTLKRISALEPRNVLEIGCGLGIIAYPLSRSVESYLACDFSEQIIALNQVNAAEIDTGNLTFLVCEAIDIDRYADRIRAAGVDTVVINSVIQYFPDTDYLDAVLDRILAIDCVRHVFVGDVRNHDLLDELSLSVVDSRSGVGKPLSNLERLTLARSESDQVSELLVSDRYWTRFAEDHAAVMGVSVLPRLSTFSNELLDFRYDVVLSKDPAGPPASADQGPAPAVREGGAGQAEDLCATLLSGESDMAIVRGLRHAGTARHCENLRAARSSAPGARNPSPVTEGMDPTLTELLATAREHGLRVSAHYARDGFDRAGRLDVAILPKGDGPGLADTRTVTGVPDQDRRSLANVPWRGHSAPALADLVTEEIARTLPVHMRPDRVVEVPAFPLNKTGKIDHTALRALIPARPDGSGTENLVGPTEERLAGILTSLLPPGDGVDRESDFFAVGGHSLLATKYVHRVNREFGLELRVKAVFDQPRLRDFAALVERRTDLPGTAGTPGALLDAPPISPLQRRFWTMDQASGPSTLYNSLLLLELAGPLSVPAMRTAFSRVVDHHRVLRSHFRDDEGTLTLRVLPGDGLALAHLDVPGVDMAGAERILYDRINRPFDLGTGPLLDAALITASENSHYLVASIHHAIFDGASEAVFLRDLEECYTAFLEGREPRWADDGTGFLRHLASSVEAESPSESLGFWSRHLAGAPELHSLPLDRERSGRVSVEGASFRSMLDEDTTRLVAELARRHRTTEFVVLNTLVGLFVAFQSGEDDVVIGSPVDCRRSATDDTAVGLYVNTVAFRHQVDWERTPDDLVAGARDFFHDAFAHADLPFDQLVEELNPRRVPGVNPLFQIMFALQPEGEEDFAFHGCRARSVKTATVRSKFDLTLNARKMGGRLHIHWEYDRLLFDDERIERTAAFFGRFVRSVAEESATPLAELRFSAGDGAAAAVLEGPREPISERTYLNLFARAVVRSPGRTAVRDGGGVYDYRSLDTRADALAELLQSRGVGRGDLVAVTLRRSAETLTAMLAVNRVGAAYVPMDSDYLRRNAAEVIREHGIGFAVVEDSEEELCTAPVVRITRSEIPDPGAATASPRTVDVRDTDPCYVIFTSGSTGKPKGVVVPHRSVVNYLDHCGRTYLRHAPETAVVSSPVSFDATVTTTLFALSAGLTLAIVEEGSELSGLDKELGSTERLLLKLTPSHLTALANLGATGETRHTPHTFVIGGEDLKAAAIAPWFEAYTQSTFFNEYGPTEATVGCVVHQVTPADTVRGSVPIGTPIRNTTIALVRRGGICLTDQRGEIVILGEGLAQGYLDRAQTNEAFRPQAALDGRIGYHTGDLASLTGPTLRYHGRSTRDIKIRGFRVSLAEIEATVGDLDDVAQCACDVVDGGSGLRAYVVPRAGVAPSAAFEARLREAVGERLPSYMVPDTLRLLPEIPLTANGKVDLEGLARLTPLPAARGRGEPDGPVSPVRALHTLWQEILDTSEELPKDVSFFSLGGNSLSMTRLLKRLNDEFAVELSLERLYREVTLERQAALLASGEPDRGEPACTPSLGAEAPGAADEVDLTAAQRRMLLVEKLGSGADYVSSIVFRGGSEVDTEALGRALTALTELHPILRSEVVERGERLVLRPGTDAPPLDVVGVAVPDRTEAEERMARARESAVNVHTGPLFGAFVYTLPDGTVFLQMLVHHVIFDGWSEKVLLEDLGRLCDRAVQGAPATEPDPCPVPEAAPFQEYAWRSAREPEHDHTDWWIERLRGAPPAHSLPMSPRERAERTGTAANVHRVLDGDTLGALNSEARRLGTTLFNTLHGTLALAVCSMSYEDDVVIGVPTANRPDPRYHGTVGLFMETLPLRTRLSGAQTFGEVVQGARETLTEALGRTDFRVEEVLNACAPHRDGTRNALYQIMFSFNDEGGESLTLGGARVERVLADTSAAKLDLVLNAKIVDGALHLYWEYDTDLFQERVVVALARHFEEWLCWALEHPGRAIGDYSVEEHDVPSEPSAERPERHRALSAYERFASAWSGREHEIALVEDDVRLSAERLHHRVLAMADRLVSHGAGRKSVVGCRSERVVDHTVTFLACSRLGAVYVPIDQANPGERIERILRRCDMDALVAEPDDAVPGYPVVSPTESTEPFEHGGDRRSRPSSPTAVSHLLFTSGTTGEPKGVPISNAALDAYVTAVMKAYGPFEGPVAQCANTAFDIFVEELALSVLAGERLEVVPREYKADPSAFARFVEERGIGVLTLATSYWAFLVTGMGDDDLARLRGVGVCVIGGEDYPPAAAERWFDRFPEGPRLINSYGPTENGPVSLFTELGPDTPSSVLGGPLGDVRSRVRSRLGGDVPVEGRGELHLSGPQLFDGYLGGARRADYATGDVVHIDGLHGYRFVERESTMMKLSGYRVDTGEYLAALSGLPGVEDVRVTAAPEGAGVVVYVSPDGTVSDTELDSTAGAALRAALPAYMHRFSLRFCRGIPLTRNGKADFSALRDRSWSAPEHDDPGAEGLLVEVRRIWRRVLSTSHVDDERGFFDCGGTSMEMLRLLSLLDERFPGAFELIDLYEKPSIALQAGHLGGLSRRAQNTPATEPEPTARERLARKRRARRADSRK